MLSDMLKITQRLALALPMGSQPIFRSNKRLLYFIIGNI